MTKIIAFYLPQFHTFPENDEWWGRGFTEWTNVKTALPIYEGHVQPKIPLSENYYNLLDKEVIKWQAELAKKYGVYGFCYYHYWFDGKLLMNRPMEILLNNKDIELPFCISWANENWTRAWAQKSKTVLISQTYGNRGNWIEHFNYLLPFFQDDRYIKIEGMPIFIIYRPELIEPLKDMIECWQVLARENGLPGIKLIYQYVNYNHKQDKNGHLFDYGIEYQPAFVRKEQKKTFTMLRKKIKHEFVNKLGLKQNLSSTIAFDYDDTWKRILEIEPQDGHMIPGAFVNWDNTPRHGKHGSITVGYSAEKFKKYLTKQIVRTKEVYNSEYLFLFAWNEWGEGGYLEPDTEEMFSRLEAIQQALHDVGEKHGFGCDTYL